MTKIVITKTKFNSYLTGNSSTPTGFAQLNSFPLKDILVTEDLLKECSIGVYTPTKKMPLAVREFLMDFDDLAIINKESSTSFSYWSVVHPKYGTIALWKPNPGTQVNGKTHVFKHEFIEEAIKSIASEFLPSGGTEWKWISTEYKIIMVNK